MVRRLLDPEICEAGLLEPIAFQGERISLESFDAEASSIMADELRDHATALNFLADYARCRHAAIEPDYWESRGPDDFPFVARRVEDDAVVGAIRLTGSGISYLTCQSHRRQGYGRSMVLAVVEAIPPKLGIETLVAGVLRENIASVRTLESSGFVFSGLHHGAAGHGGSQRATLMYQRRIATVP
jgi:RimJ/RimL family protein N-acetyltransferase